MVKRLSSDFTLKDYLYGGVTLAKNTDPDKYVCSGYGNGFNLHSEFLLPDGIVGKNVITFRADMSSFVQKIYLNSLYRYNITIR